MPYPKFGDGPGLDRVARIARRLGLDLPGFGAGGAVIVGSNGKGSTAAMCAALLQRAERPIGLFTSPHLFSLRERFRIDGDDITEGELAHHWDRVRAAIDAESLERAMGGFEFLFLIAADWFAARGCAHTVWEAGIGGRLDPVRLIAARRLALTSLDLEHTALLGDTLEAIAREKIAAAAPGATIYAPDTLDQTMVEKLALEADAHVVFIAPASDAPLPGAHQRANAALALAIACDIAPMSAEAARHALNATRWPGRLETLSMTPLFVIDVGHTPAGVAAALEGFRTLAGARRRTLICGASADKAVSALISALAKDFPLIIAAAATHKGAPVAEVAAAAMAANPNAEIVIAENVAVARRIALARAGEDGAIYVAGGLFLAAEARALHLGRDPASLTFF